METIVFLFMFRKRGRSHSYSSGFLSNAVRAAGAAYNMYNASHKKGHRPSKRSRVASKAKGRASMSKTAMRSRRGKRETEAIHDMVSRSFRRIYLGKGKSSRKGKGCWKYKEFGAIQIAGGEGSQATNYLACCTRQQLLADTANPNLIFQGRYGLFNLNPMQSTTGSTTYTSIISPGDDRIHIDHLRMKMEFANLENTAVTVTVYALVPKSQNTYTPEQNWDNGLTAQSMGKPIAVKLTAGANPTPGYPDRTFLDERPDFIPEFYKFWKIKNKTKFDLAGGANRVLTYSVEYGGKQVDRQYVQDSQEFIRNTSIVWMFIARGVVVADSTTVTATDVNPVKISTSPTKVGLVFTREYVCHASSPNRVQTELVYPRLMSGNPNANLSEINVVDTIQAVQQLTT